MNTTAKFECQVVSDLESHIQWIKGITWTEEGEIDREYVDKNAIKVRIFVIGIFETDCRESNIITN